MPQIPVTGLQATRGKLEEAAGAASARYAQRPPPNVAEVLEEHGATASCSSASRWTPPTSTSSRWLFHDRPVIVLGTDNDGRDDEVTEEESDRFLEGWLDIEQRRIDRRTRPEQPSRWNRRWLLSRPEIWLLLPSRRVLCIHCHVDLPELRSRARDTGPWCRARVPYPRGLIAYDSRRAATGGEDAVNDSQRQTVGPWTLGDRLGRGGNASVWRATRPGSTAAVALKLINTTKVEREPYQRFVREIEFLRDHQDIPGLLPLLGAHLPDQPDKTNQPWLAMPIATPIATALEGRPLADVVGAIAAIAYTLAQLQRDFGIAHRDIKPGNLYELDGKWLIGDFGLIAVPDAKSLTQDGRQVGPAHYPAYEMILARRRRSAPR